MDPRKTIELHTSGKIFSVLEEGDSLTDLQKKTNLSFTTIQKTVSHLEQLGLIKTKENITKRGKARECVKFSLPHKKVAVFLLDVLEKADRFFDDGNEVSPLLFEVVMMEKLTEQIKSQFEDQICSRLFEKWITSSTGSKTELSQTFDIDKINESLKNNDFFETENDLIYLNPQTIHLKARIKPSETSLNKGQSMLVQSLGIEEPKQIFKLKQLSLEEDSRIAPKIKVNSAACAVGRPTV